MVPNKRRAGSSTVGGWGWKPCPRPQGEVENFSRAAVLEIVRRSGTFPSTLHIAVREKPQAEG